MQRVLGLRHRAGDRTNERGAGVAPWTPALMVVFIMGTFLVFAIFATGGTRVSTELERLLLAAGGATAMVLAAALWLESRHDDWWSGLALAAAIVLLGVLAVGVPGLAGLSSDGGFSHELNEVRWWMLVAGLGLLIVVASRAGSRPPFSHAWLIMAIPTAVAVAAALPLPGIGGAGVFELALGSSALGIGATYLGTGRGRFAWLAVALVALALAEVGRLLAADPGGAWAAGVPVIAWLGMLFAVAGIIDELAFSNAARAAELLASREDLEALRAIGAAQQLSVEERDHEARSALTAIEFTLLAMKRRSGELRATDLEEFELALTAELALLRRLVTLPDPTLEHGAFNVAAALIGVVAAHRAEGLLIELTVDDRLTARGVPVATAEILQILLDNVRQHAFGSPAEVSAERYGEWVVVIVSDAGPGVPEAKRHLVFRRGRDAGHPSSATGRGLGLYLAEGLARTQGGVLWVEEAEGGGASFRLALPALAAPTAPAPFGSASGLGQPQPARSV